MNIELRSWGVLNVTEFAYLKGVKSFTEELVQNNNIHHLINTTFYVKLLATVPIISVSQSYW